jgi:hypothetical protein
MGIKKGIVVPSTWKLGDFTTKNGCPRKYMAQPRNKYTVPPT